MLLVLLHFDYDFLSFPDGHWPDFKSITVARLSTLDLQKSTGSGPYLLCLLSLDRGVNFQHGWFTCQHLDLARATVLSCAPSY